MIKLKEWEEILLLPYKLESFSEKINAIRDITSEDMPIPFESKLLLTQAILDGEWEVEEPLYYVHLVSGEGGYLNMNYNGGKYGSKKSESIGYKTKFTRAEVEAIDPRYLEFLEEVE